jgi:hypothetical protein
METPVEEAAALREAMDIEENPCREKLASRLGVTADLVRKPRHRLNQLCEFILP